ncbi:MAG: cupin domain-containing protein [Chitinophagaceae bacterium]
MNSNKDVARPARGIKVSDGDNRLHETLRLEEITPIDYKVSGADTGGDLAICVSSNNHKGTGPALHVHPDLDETFFILESEFKYRVGDEFFYLKVGDSIFIPRNIPHAFTCTSDIPGKLLIVVQPAGKLEEFFRAWSKFDKVTPEIALTLMMEHNMEVLGPPLTVD